MEYCPEIAVLQSAFQLVSKQAGKTLSDLPKEKCQEYVKIIFTTIEEICTGLEHDLDLEQKLLWQEKLHLALFYTLVRKKYKEMENQMIEGKVAVCGTLDLISAILPVFSSSFYFELMKQCDWTEKFLQSLQCLDYKTASLLFDDLVFHSRSNPVTFEDSRVITVVEDKLLSRCLCVPDYPSELSVKLLEPLTQASKFVQTIFPEENIVQNENIETMEIKNGSKLLVQSDMNTTTQVGTCFWDSYVEKNPELLDTVMTQFESVLEDIQHEPKEICGQRVLLETVAKLGMWNYLVRLGPDSDVIDKWFINNVQVPENGWNQNCSETTGLIYSLNFTLLHSLCKNFPLRKLHSCLQKAVGVISNQFCKVGGSRESDTAMVEQKLEQSVHIVAGLTVNLTVLLRMLTGMYRDTEHSQAMLQESWISEDAVTDMVNVLKKVQEIVTHMEDTEAGVVLGNTWSEDVTLETLLRRIDGKLPQYRVCVDRLMEDSSMKFWRTNRLYSVISKHVALLSSVDKVLRLTHILESLKEDQSWQKEQSLLDLICAAFSELSFPDQDAVVMEIYCRAHSLISGYFQEGLVRKITNVFNKVTADLDVQILSEVMLLCLGDPVLVLRTAISLCIRNEQQALNCALISQQLAMTCQCRHPVKHPDISLLALVVQDFLSSQSLSEKEKKLFCIFVSELMKANASKSPVLSPTEFLHTSVLPYVSAEHLLSTNKVSCYFAASLLLIALEGGCNKSCDWSEYDFEPMALVLSLCELRHECVALWEMKTNLSEQEEGENAGVAMETSHSKLALKQTVHLCLAKLCKMVHDGYLSIQQSDLRWLLEVTADTHWTVKFGLCPLFSACNFEQFTDEWLSTLDSLLEDLNSNLVPVLQFITVDRSLVPRILDSIAKVTYLESSDLTVALIQVLPQCLSNEFESVVMFLEGLQSLKTVHVSMIYRLRSTFNLPLLDFTEVRPALYTSQLLGDMIMCLATTLTSEEGSMPELAHVVQCYVSVMKRNLDRVIESKKLQLIYLGEIFHHVCEVTFNLQTDLMNSTLVILLHILNKFKDVAMAVVRDHRKNKVSLSTIKQVKNIENGMISVVQGLPDECEEKHMILKKLCDQ